jgi:hypothetical protein
MTREELIGVAAVSGFLLVYIVFIIAIHIPAGRAMQVMLRQVYAPRRVTISTLKTANGLGSCGWYVVDELSWRYLNTREGLWAEGLSSEWRSQSQAAADLQDRWSYCMTRTGRGHSFDGLVSPVAAAYLNATAR